MSLVLTVELLLILSSVFAGAAAPVVDNSAVPDTRPAYVRRGDEVEARYKEYAKRLGHCYDAFKAVLKTDAPDLYKKLIGTPPKPIEYGYQILPKLTPLESGPPQAEDPNPRPFSTTYSWSRTESFIDAELPKLAEFEEKLKIAPKLTPNDRKAVLEKMVLDYPLLESNQKIIDNHVSYNRFWQAAITGEKQRFDHLTEMHDKVLERQAIADALSAKDEDTYRKAIQLVAQLSKGIDFSKSRSDLEADLSIREKSIAKEIHSQNDHIQPSSYVKIKHPRPNVWVFHVPVYTDIGDRKFVEEFKKSIEKVWYVEDRQDVYRTEVEIRYISPEKLYKGRKVPKKGEHIDVESHVSLFPKDGGVLTTGANSTYAIPGRHVALGPYDTAMRVLAHEFGHLLGYIDGYFRGYRDRGSQGYEVLEIVPDMDDIMCTPGAGHVRRHHFETIIELKGLNKETPPAPRASGEKKGLEILKPGGA